MSPPQSQDPSSKTKSSEFNEVPNLYHINAVKNDLKFPLTKNSTCNVAFNDTDTNFKIKLLKNVSLT